MLHQHRIPWSRLGVSCATFTKKQHKRSFLCDERQTALNCGKLTPNNPFQSQHIFTPAEVHQASHIKNCELVKQIHPLREVILPLPVSSLPLSLSAAGSRKLMSTSFPFYARRKNETGTHSHPSHDARILRNIDGQWLGLWS